MTARLFLAFSALLVFAIGCPAHAADIIQVGILNAGSSWCLLIGDEKGYFREQNIALNFTVFDSGAKMIPPLATGDLSLGVGAASSALYNAVERGIDIKVLADALRNAPGYGTSVLVRKDLLDNGTIKTLRDLKGRKVAISARGSSEESSLDQAMKSVGLTFDDVDKVYMGFPDHLAAFRSAAIDASLTGEPNASAAIHAGVASFFKGVSDYYPNMEESVLMANGDVLQHHADLLGRFMLGFLKAVRLYNDALKDGHIAGRGAEDIIAILAKRSNVHDPQIIRDIRAISINPDGLVNATAMTTDWKFFLEQKEISGKVSVAQVIDNSIVNATLPKIGPYQPPN